MRWLAAMLAVLLGMFFCGVTGMMMSTYSAGYYMFGLFLLVLMLGSRLEKGVVEADDVALRTVIG